jgi:hypothetical protein
MAGAGHSVQLQQTVLPTLLQHLAPSTEAAQCSPAADQLQAASLLALPALARASAELRPGILSAIRLVPIAHFSHVSRPCCQGSLVKPCVRTLKTDGGNISRWKQMPNTLQGGECCSPGMAQQRRSTVWHSYPAAVAASCCSGRHSDPPAPTIERYGQQCTLLCAVIPVKNGMSDT